MKTLKLLTIFAALTLFALPQSGTKVFATANTQWLVSWDADGSGQFNDIEVLLTFRPAANGVYSYCQAVKQNTAHTYTVLLPGAIPCGDATSFNMNPNDEAILMLQVDGTPPYWRTGPAARNPDGKVHAVVYGPMLAN